MSSKASSHQHTSALWLFTAVLGQVREYKADLAKLQESGKGAAASASGGAAARAELGLHDDYAQSSGGQRDRLLHTTEKLGRTGERITQGRQQLLETEVGLLRMPSLLGLSTRAEALASYDASSCWKPGWKVATAAIEPARIIWPARRVAALCLQGLHAMVKAMHHNFVGRQWG